MKNEISVNIKTVKDMGDTYFLNNSIYVPKNAEGNREYEAIKKWIEDGNIPEPQFTQNEMLKQAVLSFEQIIKEHIQEPIHIYNKAKGLTLENIDSCFKYSTVETYTHKAFCKAVFLWSVEVWEWLRAEMGKIQTKQRAMPETKEALLSELETAKPFNVQEFL